MIGLIGNGIAVMGRLMVMGRCMFSVIVREDGDYPEQRKDGDESESFDPQGAYQF